MFGAKWSPAFYIYEKLTMKIGKIAEYKIYEVQEIEEKNDSSVNQPTVTQCGWFCSWYTLGGNHWPC